MSNTTGRRFGKRFAHSVHVELHGSQGRRRLISTDVSRHGMFLAADPPPPASHAIFLTVHLPVGSFETMATVAHRTLGDQGAATGAGIKFFCMASLAKQRWDAFISRLEGEEISLTPRQETASDSASFLVQLDRPQEMVDFFQRHIESGHVVHVAPPVRKLGAEVRVVLVHPDSFDEFVFVATVVELDPETPLRMGIRFEEVSALQRDEFTHFVGVTPGGNAPESDEDLVLMPAARRKWTEYAFFSPKLRKGAAPGKAARSPQTAPATTAAAPAASPPPPPHEAGTDPDDFDIVVEEPLDQPGLELVDREQLFDFSWRNDQD